ncbi:MAG: hypothetical protein A2V93_03295 [Ignavibacteria bacterium RBG_16_34_14]|nr:MAG: hypothetical protein A2V93_03295 [Ignavibacteria bacterium RBG_16_34_14]
MKYGKFLVIFIILFTFSAFAQNEYSKEPGYFNFGDLSMFEQGDGVTEVFLESNILQLVATVTEDEEPELSAMLNGLQLVKVNVFEVSDKNENGLRNKIDDLDKKLVSQKWDRIVRTKGGEEVVNVYIKTSGKKDIEGLVVTTLDKSGEAVFVNIVGIIDLKKIGKLGAKFDIPTLDKIDKQ